MTSTHGPRTLFQTIEGVDPTTPAEQIAYGNFLDQRAAREAGRQDRIHGAVGVIPAPLWLVILFTAGVIFVFMLFFADSGERAITQAMLMGSVVAVISATLLLLQFLDNPYSDDFGGIRPVAMQRALRIIDQELGATGRVIQPPCDERGNAS